MTKATLRAAKRLGIQAKQCPEICILSEKEMGGGSIASYSPIDNRIYVTRALTDPKKTVEVQKSRGIYARPDHPDSSIFHEMQHYKDAMGYRRKGREISKKTYHKYLSYLNGKHKIKLKKLGINDESDALKISKYAEKNSMQKNTMRFMQNIL